MQTALSVLCLLVTMDLALAWYRRTDNPVYGGWAPNRRSHYMCIEESGFCKKSYQCCDNNVCSVEAPFVIGTCKPMAAEVNVGPFPEYGWKKADQECETSNECADQCCRRIKIGRKGYMQKCGKPGEYACVRSNSNDIYG